jgi:uncharacterized protein YciI
MSERSGATTPTQAFLGKEVYAIRTRPAGDAISREMLTKHLANQVALEKEGIMFAAGPLYDEGAETPDGGLIVVRASSFEEAHRIAMRDPLHASGLRTYTLQRWRINEGSYTVTVNYSDQSVQIG